jgi:hypothetical protein
MEFYSAMKKNEILSFASKWMELENIILSYVSQAQKTIYQANGPLKQARLITYKVDFTLKLVRRDKVGHVLLIEGAISKEEITIIN